jgi:hypothetical protein
VRPPAAKRLAVRCAGAALLILAVVGAGCDRPPDEAWLRFLGFARTGETASLALLEGKLRDGITDAADANFENRSLGVARDTAGTGVLVFRARVDYRMTGFAPPPAEYAVNLYLPAATGADASTTTATLTAFPLATAALKHWLIETQAFEDAEERPTVDLTAIVTFFGVTDEGTELQTSGGISLSLANTN